MDVQLEYIILIASTLAIILSGFVALFWKFNEVSVSMAKIITNMDHVIGRIEDMKTTINDHEDRLDTIEMEHAIRCADLTKTVNQPAKTA